MIVFLFSRFAVRRDGNLYTHLTPPTIGFITRISHSKACKYFVWNSCSASNKIISVAEMVVSNRIDVLFMYETWLKPNNSISLSILRHMLPLHHVTNLPPAGCGGGIAVITGNGSNIVNNKRQCYDYLKNLKLDSLSLDGFLSPDLNLSSFIFGQDCVTNRSIYFRLH